MNAPISIRNLQENDLIEADRILRVAFGTFLGLPDPMKFMGDAEYVRPRWRTDPRAAFAADVDGKLAGSTFAVNWGSVGYFGPLSVRPDLWDKGVAKRLMEPMMGCFEKWGTRNAGLFTFAHSTKHVGLYQKFGFCPRFLTALTSKAVGNCSDAVPPARFSQASDQNSAIQSCRELTDSIHGGLDLTREIRSVREQKLGDTVLLWNGSVLDGFAVCHFGAGSEGGSGKLYIKFGAARTGGAFEDLLGACEVFASHKHLPLMTAGVNVARDDAYLRTLARGFRTDHLGVAMQKPNDPAYNRPGVYIIDDWR